MARRDRFTRRKAAIVEEVTENKCDDCNKFDADTKCIVYPKGNRPRMFAKLCPTHTKVK